MVKYCTHLLILSSFALTFLKVFCFIFKYSRESFQWMNDCRYEGRVLETINGISSLMQCGRLCLKNKDCTTFNFAESTCFLVITTDPNDLNLVKFSVCGMIPDRYPKLCTWHTSDDRSYQWGDDCMMHYFTGDATERIGLLNPCNSTRTCAEACLANQNCYFFYYQTYENGYCVLEKYLLPSKEEAQRTDRVSSGFIIARKYNVEFIPNYCDLK